MFPAMRGLSQIFALLAAIMLVIVGTPAFASAQACDPCPPDCAMMKQRSPEQTADHWKAGKSSKADNPCQQMVVCQTVTAGIAPSELISSVTLTAAAVAHLAFDPLQAPSRPPDRSLRPPIHI